VKEKNLPSPATVLKKQLQYKNWCVILFQSRRRLFKNTHTVGIETNAGALPWAGSHYGLAVAV
jgi:hypothetical protein